jgi:hypothetical protein
MLEAAVFIADQERERSLAVALIMTASCGYLGIRVGRARLNRDRDVEYS